MLVGIQFQTKHWSNPRRNVLDYNNYIMFVYLFILSTTINYSNIIGENSHFLFWDKMKKISLHLTEPEKKKKNENKMTKRSI